MSKAKQNNKSQKCGSICQDCHQFAQNPTDIVHTQMCSNRPGCSGCGVKSFGKHKLFCKFAPKCSYQQRSESPRCPECNRPDSEEHARNCSTYVQVVYFL